MRIIDELLLARAPERHLHVIATRGTPLEPADAFQQRGAVRVV
jgi:hypothetical protein